MVSGVQSPAAALVEVDVLGAHAVATIANTASTSRPLRIRGTSLPCCRPGRREPSTQVAPHDAQRLGSHLNVRDATITAPTSQIAITRMSDQWNVTPR